MQTTLNTLQLTFALCLILTIISSDIPLFGGPVSRIGIACKEQFHLVLLTIMTVLLQTIPKYIQLFTRETKTHEDKLVKMMLLLGWAHCMLNTYKLVTRWEGQVNALPNDLPWAGAYQGMCNSVYYEIGFQSLIFITLAMQ